MGNISSRNCRHGTSVGNIYLCVFNSVLIKLYVCVCVCLPDTVSAAILADVTINDLMLSMSHTYT